MLKQRGSSRKKPAGASRPCASSPTACSTRRRAALMSGHSVEPIQLRRQHNVADLIDHCYAMSGFNGRRLAEACQLYSHMLEAGATVGLTLSGAMTPIGMQGILIDLMRAGFVDWIISTGANLYHDLHRAFDCPVRQGHWAVDDNELADHHIARIYDVFISDEATLMATDDVIADAAKGLAPSAPLSTAELHWQLGRGLARTAPHPEKSMLIAAQQCDVPIYTSSPGDSSVAMALVLPHMFGRPVPLDPLKDVIQTAALIRDAQSNGVVLVGGGSPKNFYLQTQPMLDQFLHDERGGGHDYFIQLTTDAPHWGGLSGATPSEAKSWGKVKDALVNNVVVYSCASLTFPLLAQYALIRNRPRKLKRLYRTLDASVADMRASAARNPKLRQVFKRLGLSIHR